MGLRRLQVWLAQAQRPRAGLGDVGALRAPISQHCMGGSSVPSFVDTTPCEAMVRGLWGAGELGSVSAAFSAPERDGHCHHHAGRLPKLRKRGKWG